VYEVEQAFRDIGLLSFGRRAESHPARDLAHAVDANLA